VVKRKLSTAEIFRASTFLKIGDRAASAINRGTTGPRGQNGDPELIIPTSKLYRLEVKEEQKSPRSSTAPRSSKTR